MAHRFIHVVGAAIMRDGRCLVAQRGAAMSTPLKWEFPGGKIEPGELPEQALARELREELGIEVAVGEILGRGTSGADDHRIVLDVYTAALVAGTPQAHEHAALAWLAPSSLRALDWADADVPIVEVLLHRITASGRR